MLAYLWRRLYITNKHEQFEADISAIVKGDVDDSPEVKEFYSHDASMFELVPEVVVAPKDADDIKQLVKFAVQRKQKTGEDISITARSGGTCMSGGAINESIVIDMTAHFNTIEKSTHSMLTHSRGCIIVTSRQKHYDTVRLCRPSQQPRALHDRWHGRKNSGGELSLRYGKTQDFVTELKVIFADGIEYVVKPLTKAELDKKIAQKDYEGNLYKQVYKLIESDYDNIQASRPNVSKDSTGITVGRME